MREVGGSGDDRRSPIVRRPQGTEGAGTVQRNRPEPRETRPAQEARRADRVSARPTRTVASLNREPDEVPSDSAASRELTRRQAQVSSRLTHSNGVSFDDLEGGDANSTDPKATEANPELATATARNYAGDSAPAAAGSEADQRFEPDGAVEQTSETVDGVEVQTQTYQNAEGGEVTVKDYETGGAQVEQRSVTEADGSSFSETTSTGADGVVQVTRIDTLPNGEQTEVVTVTRPDGVVETTNTHRYQTDESIEELTGQPLEGIHPPTPEPVDTSNGPVITNAVAQSYDPAPSEAESGPGRPVGETTVEETTRTVYDPSQDPPERVVAEGVSYTQKRGETRMDGTDVPGDVEYDPSQSGYYVTYTQVTQDGNTQTSQTHETRIVGTDKDSGQPVSASRAHTWDPVSGALTTVSDVRGFRRYHTDDDFNVNIDGQNVNLQPEPVVSDKDPTDHIHDKGDKFWTDGGGINDWLGVDGDEPLDVRVTVTQSPTGERQELIEVGGYADPGRDGKTVTRIEDDDGTVSWMYRNVSDGGNLIESQHVIEGTQYSAVDRTQYTDDGGYDYTRNVRNGDDVLEETSLSRHPIVGPPSPYEPSYTYQETSHSKIYDPETGELVEGVDSTRYDNPETGQSSTQATVTNSEGVNSITTTRDPGGDPALEVNVNGADSAQIDKEGRITVNGTTYEPDPSRPGTVAASDELALYQALLDENDGLQRILGPASLLVGLHGVREGLATQDLVKTLSGLGGGLGGVQGTVALGKLLAPPGSRILPFLNNPALKGAGKAAGALGLATGAIQILQGDYVNGAFDLGLGGLGLFALTNPWALGATVALTLGKIGYNWAKDKIEGTRTEGIEIGS